MVGTTVSQSKILEKIGGGSLGVVYKVQDLKPGRTVALKPIHYFVFRSQVLPASLFQTDWRNL